MPSERTVINSLNGGAITPKTNYRKELAKVQNGCEKICNGFVLPFGGVSNRAGLRFVSEVKDSDEPVKLERFEVDGEDALLMEIGPLYFRYFFLGGAVKDGGTIVETVTPYTAAAVPNVFIDQSNDVATVVESGYQIRELARTDAVTFEFDIVDFQPVAVAPVGLSIVTNRRYTGSAPSLAITHDYAVATIASNGEESLLSASITSALNELGFDRNDNVISWAAVADATEYAVYKKKTSDDIWGYIGRSLDETFQDDGIAPSAADGPQEGENPFNAAGDYPGLVTFVQQRRTFAKMTNEPQSVKLSQSGNFPNFGTSVPLKDDDSIAFTLAARKKQDVNHIVPLEKGMIVFTRAGEWRVTGRSGDVITPSSIVPEPQSYWGSDPNLKPLIVGEQLLFVTRTGRVLRDMEYSVSIDRYKSTNLTIMAEHLFRGKKIVAYDYAQEPDGLIFCVMDDGTCNILTYLREHEVWGWSQMDTSGKILDVQVISENGIDVPYFQVIRRVGGVEKKFIEFMEQRDFTDIRDAFFVDSGLTYDAPLSVTNIVFSEFPTITSVGHGLSAGDLVELDKIDLRDDSYKIIGTMNGRYRVRAVTDVDNFTLEPEYGDEGEPVQPLDMTKDNSDVYNYIEYADANALYFDGDGCVRKGVTTVSGLDHLEGRDVAILADGNVIEGKSVSGGDVVFDYEVFRAHIGLGYVFDLETLDSINRQRDDSGSLKTNPIVYVELYESRGLLWGPNFDDLTELESREYEDFNEPNALMNGEYQVTFWDDYNRECHVCARQVMPLPALVQKITQEIEYGG